MKVHKIRFNSPIVKQNPLHPASIAFAGSLGGRISHREDFRERVNEEKDTDRRMSEQQQREGESGRGGIRLSGRISVYRPNKPAFNGPLENWAK